jgi:hypothetical protein
MAAGLNHLDHAGLRSIVKTVATFALNGGTIDSSIDRQSTYGYLFSVEIPTVGGTAD